MRFTALLVFGSLLLPALPSLAAAPPAVECLLTGPEGAAASLDYNGKTYHFSDAACKEEFLTDPERFSQLYDTLLELKEENKPLPPPPAPASAVPA